MSEPQPDHILQTGLGFWPAKTLLSAVEMELFTELPNTRRISKRCRGGWACTRDRHAISLTRWCH